METALIVIVGFFIGVGLGIAEVEIFSGKWLAWVLSLNAVSVLIIKSLLA